MYTILHNVLCAFLNKLSAFIEKKKKKRKNRRMSDKKEKKNERSGEYPIGSR